MAAAPASSASSAPTADADLSVIDSTFQPPAAGASLSRCQLLASALLTRDFAGETHTVLMQDVKATTPATEKAKESTRDYVHERWLSPPDVDAIYQAEQQAEAAQKADRHQWWGGRDIVSFHQRFEQLTGVAWSSRHSHQAAALESATFRWTLAPTDAAPPAKPAAAAASSSSDSSAAASLPLPKHGFDTPFHGEDHGSGGTRPPIFLAEIELNAMAAQLRDKSDWWRKVENPLIRFKWLCEMRSQAPDLSPKATAYAIQEIQHWAREKEKSAAAGRSFLVPTAVDGVWQSDDAVSDELRQKILTALKPLENVPPEQVDYHPNSHEQVINLVHPSLHCLRIGKSYLTKEPFSLQDTFVHVGSSEDRPTSAAPSESSVGTTGRAKVGKPHRLVGYTLSKTFAWLPSEFEVDSAGRVKIDSYINNLHPFKHRELYDLLASAFERCLPLLERVLTDLARPPAHRMGSGYQREELPTADRMEERLAWRAWNRAERDARKSAPKQTPAEEKAAASEPPKPLNPLIPSYLVDFPFEPMSDLQRQATSHVFKQVHPDKQMDLQAMALIGKLQDGIAHILLQENFKNPTVQLPSVEAASSAPAATPAAAPAPAPPARHPLKVGIQTVFSPAIHAGTCEIRKHATSESAKAIAKFKRSGNDFTTQWARSRGRGGDLMGAGLVFESAVPKRCWKQYRNVLQRAAQSGDEAAKQILARIPAVMPKVTVVSLAAQLEYFTAEVQELAGNEAEEAGLSSISAKHIKLACSNDEELTNLCLPIIEAHEISAANMAKRIAAAAIEQDAKEPDSNAAAVSSLPITYGGLELSELPAQTQPEEQEDAEEEEEEEEDEDAEYENEYDSGPLHHDDVIFPFPCPPSFDELPAADRISLRGRRLQVIVKLAHIVLKPDDAMQGKYGGGSWHVEGMENENIVASAIVYLESENITESRLAFRHAAEIEEPHEEDNRTTRELYGIGRGEACVQVLGSVSTRGGRTIAFPNLFQHQVQPFELADPTKPGHRKILVFFLVDPSESKRVTSTATVPPQQREWVSEYLKSVRLPAILESTPLIPDLAQLVVEYIGDSVATTITLEQACADRLKLMAERSTFVEQNTQQVFAREFSLCEH